jgi:riboflavin kinase/FMN adenylyltransferase
LAGGNVREAARLLNRRYSIRGTVGAGQRRGRTIGFPTANLENVSVLLPADGVYAVRIQLDGVWHAGAANIGSNPTFGENTRKIEVHLLDFSGDLYGRKLQVEFVERIRDTRSFANSGELTDQLFDDVNTVRRIMTEVGHA